MSHAYETSPLALMLAVALTVSGCGEKSEPVRAIDTQARMKDALGVFGVPHAILLEPEGYVIWEGFPLLEGYELTDEVIEKILEVGRKQKAAGAVGR